MNLYRITIKPVTSFCSPLQSDTLFGAFCWSYVSLYGEEVLNNLITRYKKGNPDIVFSNAFPTGTLPVPLSYKVAYQSQNDVEDKLKKYQKYIHNKKIESIQYVSVNVFNEIINGNNVQDFADTSIDILRTSWRNMVNRASGTVTNTDGDGSLFEVEEVFSKGTYDVYIYTGLSEEIVTETLRRMFWLGIGAHRSIGKGAFDMIGGMELVTDLNIPKETNAIVSLSNFIPDSSDPVNGYYKTFVKYPKMSYVSGENSLPFKKPMIFFKAGSVLKDDTPRFVYGSCMSKVALVDGVVSDDVVMGTYTIAIPCRINEQVE